MEILVLGPGAKMGGWLRLLIALGWGPYHSGVSGKK